MPSPAPESLYWLLPPPADYRPLLKAVVADPQVPVSGLAPLAAHALDLDQLVHLAKAVRTKRTASAADGSLSPVRLAYLSDATTDYVAPAIVGSGLRHGVHVDLFVPPFGQSAQALLDPAAGLASFRPDVVLLAYDHRTLGLGGKGLDGGAADAAVAGALARAKADCDRVSALGAQPIVQTIAPPPDPWCGHLDRRLAGAVASQVAAFNDGLIRTAESAGAILFDVAALAGSVGTARWYDPVLWLGAKQPFALDMTPLYADHVGRLLGAIRGRSRKCLVLDLDNTLWGGVIGDDGLEGIALGQGSALGEAYLAVQAYALSLKARGVVLAVCSKNEDDAGRLPFRHHPEMLLKEEDIAVFMVNWDDKATNLARIAKALNIGVDALAFLDDNPAERARVRQMIPAVAIPELPEDPAWYPTALAQAGYFETVALSAEDARRAEQYRANAERAAAMEALGDIDAYHRSLEMVCQIAPFDEIGKARISQLTNKSNQYNLTTRRYTEADIARIAADPQKFTMQIRLTDRFGDNGMISVVIFDKAGEDWVCDTWLMSCRVLGRRVEEAALRAVARAALAEGATRLLGEYVPSAKNRMVADHFERLGFAKLSQDPDGRTRWGLMLAGYQEPPLPMTVHGP